MSDDPTKHDMSVDRTGEHISKKVYMMPASYNALREELEKHYPELWTGVGWFMAFNAPQFVEFMDAAFGTITRFDSDNVDGICKKYLDACRVKRGVSPLHNPSEYGDDMEMAKRILNARGEHEEAPWNSHPSNK